MKKHFIAALLAIVMCLAALSGCSVMKVFEKDATVLFEVNGEYVDCVTVNAFNNAIAPVYDEDAKGAVPDGYKFMGWSAKHDWEYGKDDRSLLISSGGIVRYDMVKDYLTEGGTAVAVPIFVDKESIRTHDLVIAWYNKDATSGLNQGVMDSFESALRAYLTSEGYEVETMDIVIRGYAGNVGPSCEAIRQDGDVDIMIGWAAMSNLTGTGGMKEGKNILENVGGISVNPDKARYAARLSDSALTVKVYGWIQTEYGNGTAPEFIYTPSTEPDNPDNPDTPVEPTLTPIVLPAGLGEPTVSKKLTVAWYNRHTDSTDSGLDETAMAAFETKLKDYLTEKGYNIAELTITIRPYDGGVGDSCAAIMAAGDVDIMVGWANNINSTGKMTEGSDYLVNYGGVTVGSTARYAAWLTNTDISKLAYIWLLCEYGEYSYDENSTTEPTDPVEPTLTFTETKLVLGWWSSSSSGLTAEVIANVKSGLEAYITANGKDVTLLEIEIREITGSVQPAGEIINQAGDFDIVVGFGANLVTVPTENKTGGNVAVKAENRLSGITMGVGSKTKTGRYVDMLDDSNDFAVAVFEWFKTADAQALFVIA